MLGVLVAATSMIALPQFLSPPAPASIVPAGLRLEPLARLNISPGGQVDDCRLVVPSGSNAFDAEICDRLRKAHFRPGTDAEGNPVAGLVTLPLSSWVEGAPESVTFPDADLTLARMPAAASVHPMVKLAVLIDQAGQLDRCAVAVSSGLPALDEAACLQAKAATFAADRDKTGAKVRSVQALTIGFGAYAKLVLKRDAAFAGLGDAGPYFPERAQRLNVRGYAILGCSAGSDGTLDRCSIKEEAPRGYDFGSQTLKMAHAGWVKVAPGSGPDVIVRIDFPASGSWRR